MTLPPSRQDSQSPCEVFNCPECGSTMPEGMFFAFDGEYLLDALKCFKCDVIFDKKDLKETEQ